jgi:hypothetical protein
MIDGVSMPIARRIRVYVLGDKKVGPPVSAYAEIRDPIVNEVKPPTHGRLQPAIGAGAGKAGAFIRLWDDPLRLDRVTIAVIRDVGITNAAQVVCVRRNVGTHTQEAD